MRRFEGFLIIAVLCASGSASPAASLPGGTALDFGTTATPKEVSEFFAIKPDGKTLPPGSGTVAEGKEVFANACAMCHGQKLEGISATGAPALIGGRGTLTASKPKKTVESYWPYATTLFDYIKRAMPMNAPGSLNDHQIYSLVAYILAQDNIVPPTAVMDSTTLPAVQMPNRDGFHPFSGPDHRLYH